MTDTSILPPGRTADFERQVRAARVAAFNIERPLLEQAGVTSDMSPHHIRALDIGCGDGFITELLSDHLGRYSTVFGVDPRANTQRSNHERGSAGELPFIGSTMHLVYMRNTAQMMDFGLPHERVTLPVALAEVMRVLKRGGRLAIVEPDMSELHMPKITDTNRAYLKWLWPVEGRIDALKAAGFADVNMHQLTLQIGGEDGVMPELIYHIVDDAFCGMYEAEGPQYMRQQCWPEPDATGSLVMRVTYGIKP